MPTVAHLVRVSLSLEGGACMRWSSGSVLEARRAADDQLRHTRVRTSG
jgi:hypothetical protein